MPSRTIHGQLSLTFIFQEHDAKYTLRLCTEKLTQKPYYFKSLYTLNPLQLTDVSFQSTYQVYKREKSPPYARPTSCKGIWIFFIFGKKIKVKNNMVCVEYA